MIDVYEYMKQCQEDGMESREALNEFLQDLEQDREDFIEEYENDGAVQYGWHQQDMIDLRRMER